MISDNEGGGGSDFEGHCSGTATLLDGELMLTKTGSTDNFLGGAIVGGTVD